ncbi:hypothetical protein LTR36_003912 [Oleoguttula mirabilis]|uniref:Amino acid transporter transmembrane domain-containing protein n=1 Tax=Oleoguttula mirabilis TaxID=1507867 RepID=A0AAV9JJH2_9PEZI|nr:hypothetical protein LTR36_003912 [Oleoguttula mirabilis]
MAASHYSTLQTTPASAPSSRPTSHSSQSRKQQQRPAHPKQAGTPGTASWLSSVINLLNTIVGAGVLAMPHALSNMGITLGTLVILWAGLTSGFGLYLQTRCARYLDRGGASFFALSQITYPNAAVIFDAAIAVKCFGVGVSYLIIIGDLMPGVVRGFGEPGEAVFLVERRFWVTAFMLIVIPLSFLRRLDSLKYTSVIALVSIAYLVVLVVYHYAAGDTLADRGEVNIIKWQGAISTLASFPVIVFAYTCHQNMFSILNELSTPTPTRTTAVVGASIGSAASIYILVAITGYLSFGSNILGNIVAQYTPSVASTIGRAAIVVLVMFSYPLQVHPCRASLDAVSKWRPQRSSGSSSKRRHSNDEFTPAASGSPSRTSSLLGGGGASPHHTNTPAKPNPEKEMSELRFAILTTAIIILSYIVAMTVSSLDKVLAYVGSTGSTAISFILPGLFYYKISAPGSAQQQRLMKDGDGDDEEEEGYEGYEGSRRSGSDEDDEGEGEGGSPTVGGAASWREAWLGGEGRGAKARGRRWRRGLLRKMSLALAVYGGVVMVVCLVVNTFFVVAH